MSPEKSPALISEARANIAEEEARIKRIKSLKEEASSILEQQGHPTTSKHRGWFAPRLSTHNRHYSYQIRSTSQIDGANELPVWVDVISYSRKPSEPRDIFILVEGIGQLELSYNNDALLEKREASLDDLNKWGEVVEAIKATS